MFRENRLSSTLRYSFVKVLSMLLFFLGGGQSWCFFQTVNLDYVTINMDCVNEEWKLMRVFRMWTFPSTKPWPKFLPQTTLAAADSIRCRYVRELWGSSRMRLFYLHWYVHEDSYSFIQLFGSVIWKCCRYIVFLKNIVSPFTPALSIWNSRSRVRFCGRLKGTLEVIIQVIQVAENVIYYLVRCLLHYHVHYV